MVRGPILDFYGRPEGLGRANGERGYGSPRGEEFYAAGGLAQRFDFGLIMVDREGQGSFLPGEAPSALVPVPPELGRFSGQFSLSPELLEEVFVTAWKTVLDQSGPPETPLLNGGEAGEEAEDAEEAPLSALPVLPVLVPDGPGTSFNLSGWSFPLAGGGAVEVQELYLQSFNNKRAALLLPLAQGLPLHPRFLRPPFLDALLAAGEGALLPGAGEGEGSPFPAEILSVRRDDFTGKLLRGLSRYGVPLSDPLPQEKAAGGFPQTEAQRFSSGWMRME
jgi:hypothetical protein